jgi:hypothetical protein
VTPRTVPGAPTNVTATPGNGQATVSYAAPASNGGSSITLYTAHSTPDGRTGTSTNGGDIVVNGLTNGTSYIFTVTAENLAGVSPASTASTPVTPRTVPSTPTGVVATAGDHKATVAFTAPSDGGDPITDYTVTSSPGGITAHGTSSPIVVPGLTNGQSYTFTVVATNAAGPGAQSIASNPVIPGPGAVAPTAPTGATATAGNGQATVSFTPPALDGGTPITGYIVISSPGNVSAGGTTSPITVSGLTNGQTYTFTVSATNGAGISAPSAPSNAVTPSTGDTAPGPPTGVTAAAGNGQATVSFTAPASDGGSPITEYTVTSSGGQTVKGADSPLTVDGLTNGVSYTFTVTAKNAIGTSQPSGPSNAVTPGFVAVAPGAPTGVAASAGNGLAVVTFTPPVSNGGAAITSYRVTASPGNRTADGSGSPIIVTGLTNGQAYTFTVTATNSAGTSDPSAVSTAVTPAQPARSEPPSPPAEQPRPGVPAPPSSTTRIPPPGH